MSLAESTVRDVKLIGGRLCLDFTNTVGGRTHSGNGSTIRSEKLADYHDFVVWSSHAGAISESEARKLMQEAAKKPSRANSVFHRAIRFREALSNIFHSVIEEKSPAARDLEVLNNELREARSHEVLSVKGGEYRWQWKPDMELDRILWPIAVSASEVLTTADLSRIRRCGGEDCGWIFEDTSKNRSRQWCDMSDCGNLAKVRRFRAKNN